MPPGPEGETAPGLPRTWSSAEVANELGITQTHVKRLAASLGIGAKQGRDWRFTAANIAALRARPDQRPRRRRTPDREA